MACDDCGNIYGFFVLLFFILFIVFVKLVIGALLVPALVLWFLIYVFTKLSMLIEIKYNECNK